MGLEFRPEEFFVKLVLTISIVMNRVDLRIREIAQVTRLAAVNGLQDHGRRLELTQLFLKQNSTKLDIIAIPILCSTSFYYIVQYIINWME